MPTLYANPTRSRFFVVPDDATLAPGKFAVQAIDGWFKQVDATDIARFEVSEEVAREKVAEQLSRARDITRTLKDFAATLNAASEELESANAVEVAGAGAGSIPTGKPIDIDQALTEIGTNREMLEHDPRAAIKAVGQHLRTILEEKLGAAAVRPSGPASKPSDGRTLWMGVGNERFFLIPDGITLLPGMFEIGDSFGEKRRVEAAGLAAYEVSADEVGRRTAGQFTDAVSSIRQVFAALAAKSEGPLPKLPSQLESVGKVVSDLFGVIEKSLKERSGSPAVEKADQGAGTEAPFSELPRKMRGLSDEQLREYVEQLLPASYEASALAMRRAPADELRRFARIAREVVTRKQGDDAWAGMAAALGIDPDQKLG